MTDASGPQPERSAPGGPLAGVRVVELGSLIAGPFCGQLLGDFGAEVIKVEDPGRGDPMREWGQVKVQGLSLHWPIIGRNKKSVTADLRREEGRDLVRRLAAKADVLLENFRPGTLERWGLGPEDLWALNPRLVVTRVSGYGQDGPYAPRAGFGAIGEAMGGIRFLTGEPDRPPARVGISLGDSLAATFACLGTLLALWARERTGRGQVVDSAIYEAVFALMEAEVAEWELAGYQRQRTGSVLPGAVPSNAYRTADGEEVLIAANRDTVFARLAEVMGQPALAEDPRYETNSARAAHQEELDGIVGAWAATLPAEELLARLHEAGVPAGRVYQAKDMLADPHYMAREAIVRLAHPLLGSFPMPAPVPRLSATPGRARSLAPALGEHNEEIWGGLLGLSASELAELAKAGVI
ncbi:CaiB/BaiF CoA transferase family protein [Aciditerrimonas ferrireducens]|uniref:CaiB/BaiF CoA transferase family protein n=1 Tax=Aciditerrimonas ferrireducens TaxID=667306 RepID=A0ABV6C370_9ACTN